MFPIGHVTLASNVLLCPIAGYCDLAFRLSVRSLGGLGLASSDLVNPRGLMRQTRRSMELVETEPEDQPLCIQLYGNEPDEMANAAQWCEENGAVIIDINMGCPVDKVCKTNGGSALLRDPRLAVAMAGGVVKAVRTPVTVKMRLGWDEENIVAQTLAPMFEDVGVAAVTIHGRTAAQKFSGKARRDGITRVVESVQRIPVIGNGDIHSSQDAQAMLRETGCAGVMIGRAALSDPWIFRDTQAYLTTGVVPPPPTDAERIAFMTTHFEHLLRIKDERRACIVMRSRVSWYAKKLPPCREFCTRMRELTVADDYYKAIELLPEELERTRDRWARRASSFQGAEARFGPDAACSVRETL